MKRFNLYYLSVKQLRISQWLQEKLFLIGLAIHIYRKYHKLNPSVVDIISYQQGGKLYSWQKPYLSRLEDYDFNSYPIRDGDNILNAGGEQASLATKLKAAMIGGVDILNGKLDHDQALTDAIAARISVVLAEAKKEIQ